MEKSILDACCGARMFYYRKHDDRVIYNDCRELSTILCDGRKFEIAPDDEYDFRSLPWSNNSFKLIIFDPPHLTRAGKTSWLAKKYGVLPKDWKSFLADGFKELWRVLDKDGVLLFKWSTDQIPFSEVKQCFPAEPLLGDKKGKTRWTVFVKGSDEEWTRR